MKKKCRILDYTGENLPFLRISELTQQNVQYVYLVGHWQNMQQAFAVLNEYRRVTAHIRVVAVTFGQPCGNLSCVDRWFCLSQEAISSDSVKDFTNMLYQCFDREKGE